MIRKKEGTQRTDCHSSTPDISGVGDWAKLFRRSRKLTFLKLRSFKFIALTNCSYQRSIKQFTDSLQLFNKLYNCCYNILNCLSCVLYYMCILMYMFHNSDYFKWDDLFVFLKNAGLKWKLTYSLMEFRHIVSPKP